MEIANVTGSEKSSQLHKLARERTIAYSTRGEREKGQVIMRMRASGTGRREMLIGCCDWRYFYLLVAFVFKSTEQACRNTGNYN